MPTQPSARSNFRPTRVVGQWLVPGLAGLTVFLALPCRLARAALGEDATSIVADAAQMNGVCRAAPDPRAETSAPKYTVLEIRASSGIVVRQYIGGDAKVFAITWRGPFLPNMRQLLGTYFEAYSRAIRAKHGRHRPFVIEEPGLVVHSTGHLRSFVGEAHLPAALPEGVRAEELL